MANFITLSRIFLAFIALALLFFKFHWLPFILTVLVMWFDGLDGYVARKFNESSKLGAVLDIMGDRIVENIYWMAFCALRWINVIIPIIFITRGIVVDSLRSLALQEGYTAFGEKTMMQNPVAKFIVASNFSRFTYAVVKALAFGLMIIGAPYGNLEPSIKEPIFMIAQYCAYFAAAFCLLRGIPVVFEAKRFFKND